MRKWIFFLIVCISDVTLSAQDTLHALKIQPYSNGKPDERKKPVVIQEGEIVRVRTLSKQHARQGVVTMVSDSAFYLDSATLIRFSDVKSVSWHLEKSRKGGPILLISGAVFIGIAVALIGSDPDLGQAALAVISGATGAALALAGLLHTSDGKWPSKEISPHWRLSAI